jgi:quercetin dioxygenase-like cupin family protein
MTGIPDGQEDKMIVVNSGNVKSLASKDEIVAKGPVNRRPLLDVKETGGFGAALVTFRAGAKLNFHTHDSEQILYVTEGKGIIATKDKEYVITPGCIVFIPAGEVHMHGATEKTSLTHLAIQKAGIKLAN